MKRNNLLVVVLILWFVLLNNRYIKSSENTFEDGIKKFEQGEYFDAEVIFRDLVKQNPSNVSYLQMLAKVLMVWDRYQEAEGYLLKAKNLSDEVSVNIDLVKLYLESEQPEKAQNIVKTLHAKGVDVTELTLEVNYQLGVKCYDEGDHKSAFNYFTVVSKTRKKYKDTENYIKELKGLKEEENISKEKSDDVSLLEAKYRALEKKTRDIYERKMDELREKEAEIEYKAFQKEMELKKKMGIDVKKDIKVEKTKSYSKEGLVGTVYFDRGSSVVKKESQNILDKIITLLKENDRKIKIIGHTDSDPYKSRNRDNVELSVDRALSVKRYLVDNGIDKNRIEIEGLGSSVPVSEDKSQNRRVEIYLK
ncbi:MAG: OmpA family protein [Candidatus Hydrogenedentota bacterium]